jgi:putative ABC transport system permease protein
VNRFITSQLRFRRGRALALAGGILVAGVAFTILTASAHTAAFRTRGTITRNYRTAYDILVRPHGSTTPLERREGLVRDNYLSGIYSGISFAQWHRIANIPGVAVAAPIANVGFIFQPATYWLSIRRVFSKAPHQLYRVTYTFVANNGLSRYPFGRDYVYYTPTDHWVKGPGGSSGLLLERGPGAKGDVPSCNAFINIEGALPTFGSLKRLDCYSGPRFFHVNDFPRYDHPVVRTTAAFPLVVAAIDPVAEAKLVHLDRTVVAGRYLRADDGVYMKLVEGEDTGIHAKMNFRFAPTLISDRPYVDEKLEVRIDRLRAPPGVDVPDALAAGACLAAYEPCPRQLQFPARSDAPFKTGPEFLSSLRSGGTVLKRTIPFSTFYRQILAGRNLAQPIFGPGQLATGRVWASAPVRYSVLGRDHLAPFTVRNSPDIWASAFGRFPVTYDEADVQFRRLWIRESAANQGSTAQPPILLVVGRFDPRKLPGYSPLSRVPLETYYPPELQPADAAARAALGGHAYLPTQNLGGYVQQPPLILTTLNALRSYFLNPRWWGGGRLYPHGGVPRAFRSAPLSVIRVRVAGVKGPDTVSRERVRVVAQKIHDETGLDVDVTAGSSPHPMLISLPKGRFGQPPLLLREGWSKKNVSVVFLNAVDRKSLALFALVLVVCAFFVANGAFAVTRTRRGEIGTLRTLGWSQRAIFGVLLGELALIGLAAGVVGSALSVAIVEAFGLHLGLAWTLLVLPLSVVLACVAAVVPAWRAARLRPLEAVRPAVARGRGRRPVGHLARLALVNLRRLPARTLVGAAGLAIGIAALTLLLAIERSYHGTLVGTLLGNALALQVRGADLAAIGLTIGLAAFSVADVLYVNLRERAAEIVTLRSTGWSERQLSLLVALEAAVLGLGGSLVGAALGVALTAALFSVSLGPLVVAAVLAALGGTLTTVAASLVPLSRLRRLTAPSVLAAE